MAEQPTDDTQPYDYGTDPTGQADANADPPEDLFQYVHTDNMPGLLASMNCSLLATTYQAGKLLIFSSVDGRLKLLMRTFPRPMGVAVHGSKMALLCQNQIWFLDQRRDLVAQEGQDQLPYDSIWVPRWSHVTGDISGHEIAWGKSANGQLDELWVVNTRFSCLATLDREHSFVPQWKPPFITDILPGDRCHLNGFAFVDGEPRYATCFGESNEDGGWRENKENGGLLMDIRENRIIARGFSLPHTPRFYNGKLYVLNSGAGQLMEINPDTGEKKSIVELPGFVRGIAFVGPIAFIGLSRLRDTRTFGALPIDREDVNLECAIYAVDLRNGKIAGFIRFEKSCRELFDIWILPNSPHAGVVGFSKDTINGVFILPHDKVRALTGKK